MQENTSSISQREFYVPTRWTRFLWWLSTAEPELLADCVIDRNRYAIVGMTVLGTWAFATLAWTYFFSTVVSNLLVSSLLGLFMGGMILTIDRALIKGISRANKKSFVPLLFRGVLAFIIGLFMAQPALLYLFDKEIHVQVSLDNEQRKKDKLQKQDSVYYAQKNVLQQKKTVLLSTHILSEAQDACDRVLIIHKGKIVADGTPDLLRQKLSSGQRVLLELKAPGAEAKSALIGIPGVHQVMLQSESESGAVFVVESGGADLREAIFELAVKKHWSILQMAPHQTSLEDVFRNLTLG